MRRCLILLVYFEVLANVKDLLTAVHEYVADFFQKNGVENVCSRQFEETALLALGIAAI
jgi:hypothetical protein